MPKRSAGLLAYRRTDDGVEVLLVHPGGPYWRRKDEGAWSLPKGEIDDPGEDPFQVAVLEFTEELGVHVPSTDGAVPLGEVRQPGGKVVQAWAIEGDVDVSDLRSNLFEMEWPPRSGRTQEFPEVDRAEWFAPEDARRKILKGQAPFLDRLDELLDGG
jgi:predicted NUDIX family NTP pyrophosphohydrolase